MKKGKGRIGGVRNIVGRIKCVAHVEEEKKNNSFLCYLEAGVLCFLKHGLSLTSDFFKSSFPSVITVALADRL